VPVSVSFRSTSEFSAIVAGNLHERLPHRKANDPFSKLALIVNGMLDEMETLITPAGVWQQHPLMNLRPSRGCG